jgi:hypothetical protein
MPLPADAGTMLLLVRFMPSQLLFGQSIWQPVNSARHLDTSDIPFAGCGLESGAIHLHA